MARYSLSPPICRVATRSLSGWTLSCPSSFLMWRWGCGTALTDDIVTLILMSSSQSSLNRMSLHYSLPTVTCPRQLIGPCLYSPSNQEGPLVSAHGKIAQEKKESYFSQYFPCLYVWVLSYTPIALFHSHILLQHTLSCFFLSFSQSWVLNVVVGWFFSDNCTWLFNIHIHTTYSTIIKTLFCI